jgi:hypothetical protein
VGSFPEVHRGKALNAALKRLPLIAAAAFALLAAAPARSDCPSVDPVKWTASTASEARLCLARRLGESVLMSDCRERALCGRIDLWLDKPRGQAVEETAGLLGEVREEMENVVQGFPAAAPVFRELDRWLKQMTGAKPEDLRSRNEGPYRAEPVEKWKYVPNSARNLEGTENEVNLGKVLDIECAASAERCTGALRASGEVLLHTAMARNIAFHLLSDLRQEAGDYIDMLDKRWEKYFDTSRFQYPWELVINDWRFSTGGKAGFVSPPEDQLVVLHPSVGVRYNGKGQQNFEPQFLMEVLGYQRWRWDGAEQKGLMGGSFILAWSNQQNERKTGWGAMMHMPKNYSIGIIRQTINGSNAVSFVLSADLGKLFEDKPALKKALQHLAD